MSKSSILDSKVAVAGVLVLGGLALVAMSAFGAKKVVSGAVTAINPLNNDNVFASGVDNVGRKLTGNNNWNLGGWIYDVVNGTPEEQVVRREEQGFISSIGG